MSRTIRIKPGQVWVTRNPVTRTPSRRVIGTSGVRICYSTGGDRSRWCKVPAFRAWIRNYQAIVTRTRRARSMLLRGGGAK